MSLTTLVLVVVAALVFGYFAYGRWLARQYRLDDATATPAVTKSDGIDFVPTRPFYLLGQHFSAIAAAGPIVGPIAACLVFGWLPCVIWIVLGVILIGAVHDFSALVASVRHGAGSIAEIARQYLGRRAFVALVTFIWLALVYVIVAFTDVTAATFLGRTEELQGMPGGFNPGGAVAAASTMYLALALLMGVLVRFVPERFRPQWLITLVFVPGTLFVIWLGTRISTVIVFEAPVWHVAILAYCVIASLLPVWLLQQSRGYLGGFVLYLSIGVGVFGVLFGGFEVHQPAITEAASNGVQGLGAFLSGTSDAPPITSLVFPFLFVTIACGACSGFHGLVCGGTTSKQIAKETHCQPIGYGSMLLEALVAVIALATVMIATPQAVAGKAPGVVYGEGIARFLTTLIGPDALLFAKTFGTMAVATFVFDTLDVATRLGRYLIEELLDKRSRAIGIAAAVVTAAVPLVVLLVSEAGTWRQSWTLFGTANQLLASLTLLGISVWLRKTGRRAWYVIAPMIAIMTVTLVALGLQILAGVRALSANGLELDANLVNAIVAVAMLALAITFVIEGWRSMRVPQTS